MKFKVTESFIRNVDYSRRLQEFFNVYPYGTRKIDENQREVMFEQMADRFTARMIDDVDSISSYDFDITVYLYQRTSLGYVLRYEIRDVINRYVDGVSKYEAVDQVKESNFNLFALNDKLAERAYREAIITVQEEDNFTADRTSVVVSPRDNLISKYAEDVLSDIEEMLSKNK